MSHSRRSRYESRSYSPSPYRQSSHSRYRSGSRSVDSSDVENPGNNLYVTGLSARVTDRDLEKHFSTEGEVIDARIVLDPWRRESQGFGFVTMDCSVLKGKEMTWLNPNTWKVSWHKIIMSTEVIPQATRLLGEAQVLLPL